ncbi:unnamed protein product [Protopolystoma xenopodis]|uniref:Uncharacterized protein n=1 Tax=Protopolystoma xenopodis TaxID=117903 RepID=A0A448XQX7_9PLAT|nr:unnamed protein product [Protopolystoma xenopodis]
MAKFTDDADYDAGESLANCYWHLLELLVVYRYDSAVSRSSFTSNGNGCLSLSVANLLLSSRPHQLVLPTWLTERLLDSSSTTITSTDPLSNLGYNLLPASAFRSRAVSLLSLYINHDRVMQAYRLAMEMINSAIGSYDSNTFAIGIRSASGNQVRVL